MDREEMLATIDTLYRARMAGDTEAMVPLVAEGATFRFTGESPMQAAFGADGAMDLLAAMGSLNGGIAMHSVTRKDAVVEGNQVAARWLANVQFPGREAFDTELCNLWTFDEDGKVAKLREFCDTAKLASEVAAVGRG